MQTYVVVLYRQIMGQNISRYKTVLVLLSLWEQKKKDGIDFTALKKNCIFWGGCNQFSPEAC